MPVDMELRVEDNSLEMQEVVDQIYGRTKDLKPALKIIGQVGKTSIEYNYEVGGRPKKWAPLSEQQIERRKKIKKWPGQILVVTGALKRLANPVVDEDSVTWSNPDKRAAVHEFGAVEGSFGVFEAWIEAHVRTMTIHTKGGGSKKIKQKVKGFWRKVRLPWGTIPSRRSMFLQEQDWDIMTASLGRYLLSLK